MRQLLMRRQPVAEALAGEFDPLGAHVQVRFGAEERALRKPRLLRRLPDLFGCPRRLVQKVLEPVAGDLALPGRRRGAGLALEELVGRKAALAQPGYAKLPGIGLVYAKGQARLRRRAAVLFPRPHAPPPRPPGGPPPPPPAARPRQTNRDHPPRPQRHDTPIY